MTQKNEDKAYSCLECTKLVFDKPVCSRAKHYLPANITPDEMRAYDIWDVRILGKETTGNGGYTLNFLNIHPSWLKNAIKDFIWTHISRYSTSNLMRRLTHLRKLSDYIRSKRLTLNPQDINRAFIVDLLNYVSAKKLKNQVISSFITHLRQFFEYCRYNNVIESSKITLILAADYLKQEKTQLKDIPPHVLKQIDDNLHFIARPISVIVKIRGETGIRVSEVCNLKFNCVSKRGKAWK